MEEAKPYTVAVNALLAEGGHRYATLLRGTHRAIAGKHATGAAERASLPAGFRAWPGSQNSIW